MPFTDPTAHFANGTLVSAADLNTYLRDNLLFLRQQGEANVALARTAVQSIPDSAYTPVVWQAALRNRGTLWVVGTPAVVTIPRSGRYRLWGLASFADNGTGERRVGVLENGTIERDMGRVAPANGNPTRISFVDTLEFEAGDTLQMIVEQGSGLALDLRTESRFGVRWAGIDD